MVVGLRVLEVSAGGTAAGEDGWQRVFRWILCLVERGEEASAVKLREELVVRLRHGISTAKVSSCIFGSSLLA